MVVGINNVGLNTEAEVVAASAVTVATDAADSFKRLLLSASNTDILFFMFKNELFDFQKLISIVARSCDFIIINFLNLRKTFYYFVDNTNVRGKYELEYEHMKGLTFFAFGVSRS